MNLRRRVSLNHPAAGQPATGFHVGEMPPGDRLPGVDGSSGRALTALS
ncbi:MAG: hypothetical protein AB7P69_27495 [Candidatus Binatia bacterium]